MEGKKKIHFHSFDAFRFFAFFKVFIFHVPLVITANSTSFQLWYNEHVRFGGGIGVCFFFVLSGFLITYILTHEKLNSDRINAKRFFVRRAFRIWPLFYFLVIIALVIPDDFAKQIGFHMVGSGYPPDWRFSLTFTENYKAIIMDRPPLTTPLGVFWSLCIEEHFYILWMIVFFFIRRKLIPYFLIISIVISWVFRIFHDAIYHTEDIVNADLFTNLDFFALSGILGYLVAVNYQKVADFVMRIPLLVRYFYVGLVIFLLVYQAAVFEHDTWFLSIFKSTIFALMFTLLLLVFIPQNGKLKIAETSIFTYLGKISYGLYVYHIIWVHMLLRLFLDYGIKLDNWHSYTLFTISVFSATVITSYISYRYFEMPILKFREKLFPNH